MNAPLTRVLVGRPDRKLRGVIPLIAALRSEGLSIADIHRTLLANGNEAGYSAVRREVNKLDGKAAPQALAPPPPAPVQTAPPAAAPAPPVAGAAPPSDKKSAPLSRAEAFFANYREPNPVLESIERQQKRKQETP